MQGREAKHIALDKFTATPSSVTDGFRFLDMSMYLVWLRENGCDEIVHIETSGVYIPERCYSDQFCHCGQPM